MAQYLNWNGEFYKADEPIIRTSNRSFRYGDGLFETIRFAHAKTRFLAEHLKRLKTGMNFLKMFIPLTFTPDFFEQQIAGLASKNNIQNDGKVRLTVYRNDGGLYTPLTNDVSFVIEMEQGEEAGYILNTKGHTIDVFNELRKPYNGLSSIKSANCLIYIIAGLYKQENQLDECIILNEKGSILESISSNIFAVKNGVLYTPPVQDGCVDGIMRRQIIGIAKENRIAVYENTLALSVLLNSDEVFLTNATNGIRWVAAYKGKRYFNNISKFLIEKLNLAVTN